MRMRGWVLVPAASFVVALLSGCASSGDGTAMANQCTKGKQHPERPIVCVDNTGSALSIHPREDLVVFDRASNGAPVTILFFTKSGTGNLKIIDKDDCLDEQEHTPEGMARIKVTKAGGSETRCKYDIELAGFETLDPFIVVKPCCTLLDGPG
jgi:hypothetical protein